MYSTEIVYSGIKQNFDNFHSLVYFSLAKNLFNSDKENDRPLFSIRQRMDNKKVLIIVSKTQPDMNYLSSFLNVDSFVSCLYEKKLNKIHKGSTFSFSIETIPNRCVNGKRHFLKTEKEQKEWFIKQAEKHGFKIDSLYYSEIHNKCSHKSSSLAGVKYQGHLTVTDIDLFKQALCNGIGHQKAWGFGLLQI